MRHIANRLVNSLLGVNMKCVVIYGCGVNGINLYYRLGANRVLLFVDRSKEKQGYVLDGKNCISYEEFLSFDREQPVIVSMEKSKTVICDLKEKGFTNVFTIDDIGMDLYPYPKPFVYSDIPKMKRLLEDGLYNDEDLSFMDNDFIKSIITDYRIRKNEHS